MKLPPPPHHNKKEEKKEEVKVRKEEGKLELKFPSSMLFLLPMSQATYNLVTLASVFITWSSQVILDNSHDLSVFPVSLLPYQADRV